jgi:hypothetical protein
MLKPLYRGRPLVDNACEWGSGAPGGSLEGLPEPHREAGSRGRMEALVGLGSRKDYVLGT